MADFDGDGKGDLLSGDGGGAVWFFRNIGTKTDPVLAEGVRIEAAGKPIQGPRHTYEKVAGATRIKSTEPGSHDLADEFSKIAFADFDDDGFRDLLIGHKKGEFVLYRNAGKKGVPELISPEVIRPEEGEFPPRPSPHVVDWDGDGLKDLLVGSDPGEIHFYPNSGSRGNPRFTSGETLKVLGRPIDVGHRARFDVVDWNRDGKLDLLVGNFQFDLGTGEGKDREFTGNLRLFLQK